MERPIYIYKFLCYSCFVKKRTENMSNKTSNRQLSARRRAHHKRLISSSAGQAPGRRRRSFLPYAACALILLGILLAAALASPPEKSGGQDPPAGGEAVSAAAKDIVPFDDIYQQILRQEKAERAKGIRLINFDHPNTEKTPDNLVPIRELLEDYAAVNEGAKYADQEAAEAAREMLAAAYQEGVTTFIVNSAYRDYSTQESLWNNRLSQDPNYGSDPYAHPVKVVPPNVSEHCAGLAFDILSEGHPSGTPGYEETPEGKWLAANAHKYGFILRYPKDKESVTGVVYEPWHYRYVGKEAALDIYESGLCLEEYLLSMGVL